MSIYVTNVEHIWSLFSEDTPLLEYEVWCGKEEAFHQGIAPAEGRRTRTSRTVAKLTGLAPTNQYVFRVRALNVSGWSPWSAPSEPVWTMDAHSSEQVMSAVLRHFGNVGAAFRAFDRDRDGFVSKEEFITSLGLTKDRLGSISTEQRTRLFCQADSGGRGFLSYAEFANLFCRSAKPSEEVAASRKERCDVVKATNGECARRAQTKQLWSRASTCLRERLQQASAMEGRRCSGSRSASCNSSRASSPTAQTREAELSLSEDGMEPLRERADPPNCHPVQHRCRRLSRSKLTLVLWGMASQMMFDVSNVAVSLDRHDLLFEFSLPQPLTFCLLFGGF